MIAMIFAAGLGTRLQPLTNDRPKALVELGGKPLLYHVIRKLEAEGIQDIVINIHHFPQKMTQFIKAWKGSARLHISDESGLLLETGGALVHARDLLLSFEQPVLIHNVDVVSDINIQSMHEYHKSKGVLATLAMRDRSTSRYLLSDKKGYVKAWKNVKTRAYKGDVSADLRPLAFSGIHIVEPDFLRQIKQKGKFSIIDEYIKLAPEFGVSAFPHDNDFWMDVGRVSHLEKLAAHLENDDLGLKNKVLFP
jgi:NDP-sugar pyrophosphorylase family protein